MAISFPSSPSNGNTFTDSVSGATYIYVSPPGIWNKVLSVNTTITGTTTTYTANGFANTFTLPSSLTSSADIVVTLNGVLQIPTTHYTYANSSITFTTNPDNGDLVEIRKFAGAGVTASGVSSGGTTVLSDTFTAGFLLGGM